MRRVAVTVVIIGSLAPVAGSWARTETAAPLKITLVGNGNVSVNGSESLACNGACDATFRPTGQTVVLKAHAGAGSHFTNWTGVCLGTRSTCIIRAGGRAHVNAFFAQNPVVTNPPPASSVTVAAGKPSEFQYTLSTTTVRLGTVIFNFSNAGAIPHDFFICSVPSDGTANSCQGTGTPLNSGILTVTFTAPGTYEYLCTVSGHAAAGMKGIITVG